MKRTPYHECFSWEETALVNMVSLVLAGILLMGCGAKMEGPGPAGGDKVLIKGSNTIGEELGPRLIAEFKKTHPTVAFTLETKGSASGYWGLIGGGCDIAAASRAIARDEQEQAHARSVALEDTIIGCYSVAVIVNGSNPVGDLTRNQVRDIFTGTIQNWKDVGGPDAPIHLYVRNPASGTYLGFRELAMEDKPYTTHTEMFTNYLGIVQAVGKDANGIGYSSIQMAGKSNTKALTIGGVAATAASVKEGKYPFTRALHLCTNKAAQAPVAGDFIHFVCSAQGQQILDEVGFVPQK